MDQTRAPEGSRSCTPDFVSPLRMDSARIVKAFQMRWPVAALRAATLPGRQCCKPTEGLIGSEHAAEPASVVQRATF